MLVNRISGPSFLLCISGYASLPVCTDLLCLFLSDAEAVNEDAFLLQLPESKTLSVGSFPRL